MKSKIYSLFKNYDILCVEHDEKRIEELFLSLKDFFRDIYMSDNCEDAYDLYIEYKPQIILSDIQIKDNTSKKMIEKIRKTDLSTLIIVSNAHYDEKFLEGLINLQINHYMFKATDIDNLLLSIKKAFGNKLYENIVFSDNFYFDMKTRELIYNDKVIVLRKREKDFLLLLYKNKHSVTFYSQIEEELWGDKEMSMNALKTFINEFRKKLPHNIIVNIVQEGYKLKPFI